LADHALVFAGAIGLQASVGIVTKSAAIVRDIDILVRWRPKASPRWRFP